MEPQYTKEEIAVVSIMNYLQNNKHDELYVSVDEIGYFLTGRFIDSQSDKNLVSGIKKGITSLTKNKRITIVDTVKNCFVIDAKSCFVDTSKYNFTIIHLWEIQKIFSIGAYGFGLLKFFINIIGTINGKSKSFHMTQDQMAANWSISKNTVIEYFLKLEELKIMYTYHSNARRNFGSFHRIGNIYGRYSDKALIIAEGKGYLQTVPNRPIKEYHVNRASIRTRYNYFCKGSKKYIDNPIAVKELYDDCIKYNKSFEKFPNDKISLIDLEVFKEYEFDKIPVFKEKTENVKDNQNTNDEDIDNDRSALLDMWDTWFEEEYIETEQENKSNIDEYAMMLNRIKIAHK